MLKERIDYLCHKKNMSRKELTDGLVTQAHFSNILAGRYPLPDDLAEVMAERLGVLPGYLLYAEDQGVHVLQRAEQIVEQLSVQASALEEQQVNDLPDRHDTLTVELTTALMKATYYQQLNDQDAYAYLHQSYLNFYLERYGRPDEALLPLPLMKAMLFYKIQSARSRQQYHDVLAQTERWLNLLPEQGETWLTGQQIRMEAFVHTRQFEPAKQTFEKITSYIYEQRLFHRLSGMYVLYSGYCHVMQQPQEALIALSMAEAHLVYAQHQGDTLTAIMNNRILMLTMTCELSQAAQEVERFGSIVDLQPPEMRRQMEPVLLVYRCEIELARQDWAALVQRLEQLRTLTLTEDQQMAVRFYSSQLALAHGQADQFMEEATACLPYFEQIRQQDRLNILYESLAVVSEEQRRYKDAASYYRKLVYLLRHA